MNTNHIITVDSDHAIWIKGLEFYEDEVNRMQKKLLEVTRKNTTEEARKGIEHFQNQFFIQQKNISDLKHAVKKYINDLRQAVRAMDGTLNEKTVVQARLLKENYEHQERVMNSLRHEFNDFLGKWM